MNKNIICAALVYLFSTKITFAVGDTANVLSGLLHPILGFDHLIAMVAVGLLSIQIGGKHILGLPVCFVFILFIGALIGLLAIPIPQVEGVISLSVIVLGIAIATQSRIGIWIAYPIVAMFAFFHGHAHGGEIPSLGNPTSYITGFLIASAILHFFGIGIGTIARTKRIRSMIGSAFAGVGLHMILLIYGLI